MLNIHHVLDEGALSLWLLSQQISRLVNKIVGFYVRLDFVAFLERSHFSRSVFDLGTC